jgi:tripartite-type tricarboxylate transporter receptor subunit TctC
MLKLFTRTCPLAFLLILNTAFGDTYPSQPLRMIMPFAPGTASENAMKMVLEKLEEKLKQPIVLDNKPGAGSTLGTDLVAKAAGDGYTLLASYNSSIAPGSLLYNKLSYDAIKDFKHIALIGVFPQYMVVKADYPVKTIQDLMNLIKNKPGALNYSSAGVGTSGFLAVELLKQTMNLDLVHVPYKGSGPAIQDVLAGQVQVFITTPPSVMQHVQSGKLKGLAVTGNNRHPGMPNVPTTAEAGLPSFQLESWVALYAPAGTPAPVITKLTDSVKRSLALPEVKERADTAGVELRYLTPTQMDALLKKELPYWDKAIKSANIKLD